ncbi:MAG: dienelactone hydrolase family protein [Bryobacteraceae bacterium]
MSAGIDKVIRQESLRIPPSGIVGDLTIPARAKGIVLFAHGSGSSRFSSRNRFVARVLVEAGFAALLLDLLTTDEEKLDLRAGRIRFDIGLLAERLMQATEWIRGDSALRDLPVGCFGASTGGAAALVAAANLPNLIGAVVSRGGRPDLAASALARVSAPTLLIVGERDPTVIELNQAALKQLQCEKKLQILPSATHLFEEPGALEEVARLASGWFQRYLPLSRELTAHNSSRTQN